MKYDARDCKFNMDTGCVELLLRDGRRISIDCTGVEDALPSLHRFSSVFGNRSVRHPSIPGGRCGSDLAESGPGV